MEATFGKCNFRNLQNGVLCGCLRSRVQSNDDYSCRACDHDLCYLNLLKEIRPIIIQEKIIVE